MKKNEIASTFVYFSDGMSGKPRPVLILSDDGDNVEFFKLTTKFENKSSKIQRKYFKINDWKEAGLYKPTWIDTVPVTSIPKGLATFKPIGELSLSDIQQLTTFLNNLERNS